MWFSSTDPLLQKKSGESETAAKASQEKHDDENSNVGNRPALDSKVVDSLQKYEVEKDVAERQQNGRIQYLVRWYSCLLLYDTLELSKHINQHFSKLYYLNQEQTINCEDKTGSSEYIRPHW